MPNDKIAALLAQRQAAPADALQQVRDYLGKLPDDGREIVQGWPKVATPGQFRPYPEVIGSPELHQGVRNVLNTVPQLQGLAKRIGPPLQSTVEDTKNEGGYDHTNVLGETNKLGGDQIFIKPNLGSKHGYDPEISNEQVVLHELTHAQGHSEIMAQLMEELYKRYMMGKR